MKCPNCEKKNRDTVSFCNYCGISLHAQLLTSCTLSTKNLHHNLDKIKSRISNSNVKIIAIVKGNAYGHGLVPVSQKLEGLIDAFGVVSINEAMTLRRAKIKSPIILLEGVYKTEDLKLASDKNFSVVFHNNYQIKCLKKEKLLYKKPLNAWLKLNTGMNRLGFSVEAATSAMEALSENPLIKKPVGIMSHFACANLAENDKPDSTSWEQIDEFKKFVQKYDSPTSFCNSAAIIAFHNKVNDNWVRPGLALYGISPFKKKDKNFKEEDKISKEKDELFLDLKPVMTFHTKIISIHKHSSDDKLGYCERFKPTGNMVIGIIAVGYTHGYPHMMHQKCKGVLIKGEICPLIQVEMDMTFVDLSKCPGAKINDEVILWGEGIPIEEVIDMNISKYTLIDGIHDNRVRFEWVN